MKLRVINYKILVLELYLGSRKLEDVIETLSGLAVYIMAFSKSIRCITKKREIDNLLYRLESVRLNLFDDRNNVNSLKTLERFEKRFLAVMTVFLVSTPVLSFLLTTVIDFITNFENKRLMLQVWIPWSMKEVWPYLLAKLLASLMSLSTVATYRGLIFFDLIFTFEISTYLKILQNHLETTDERDVKVYQQHNVLLQLINEYNSIMSGQKYLETLIAPVMPCGFGLTLIRGIRRKETSQLDAIQKVACCLLPPVVACSCGQQIATQVERLHEASYMSNWYELSPRFRKDQLMLMMRTTKVTTVNYRLFVIFDHVYLTRRLQVAKAEYKSKIKAQLWLVAVATIFQQEAAGMSECCNFMLVKLLAKCVY
ncbi:hypothetical protein O3M35_008766 [Rhynocoris fuscipes]|uniref:Odorant receptor n=1 Tax=Rhynocoris fuscipes TaxID=488301 RepID=A0AAW1DA09_9HEMI